MSGILIENSIEGDILMNINIGQPPIAPIFDDWFLPSQDELNEMYVELRLHSIGGFLDQFYTCSSESGAGTNWVQNFTDGSQVPNMADKVDPYPVRGCRAFTSVSTSYNLRDIGPAGGYIFWKSGSNYLESTPTDLANTEWSNIQLAIGTTGTAIGTGQANTTAIINQSGHTDSAAKLCDDLQT